MKLMPFIKDLKMKLISLLLILITLNSHAQILQKGRVLEKDSRGKPIENTVIIVEDAGIANSGTDGRYQLPFKDKKPGELIFTTSIQKKGYELVNESQVNEWVLSETKDFNIILCKEGHLKSSREKFYKVGKSRYQLKFDEQKAELKTLKSSNLINEIEYNIKLSDIWNEHQRALKMLNDYSDLFARINKDDLTDLELRSLDLTRQGKIDEAIQLYEQEKLFLRFLMNDSASKQAAEDIQNMLPVLERYAEICAFAGGKENYDKVEKIMEAIVLSDTMNFNTLWKFSIFLSQQLNFRKSNFWLQKALKLDLNDVQLADIYGIMASNYHWQHEYENAHYYYKATLDKIKPLAGSKSGLFSKRMIETLNQWASMCILNQEFDLGESLYEEALAIAEELHESDSAKFNDILGQTLFMYAFFKQSVNNSLSALELIKRSVSNTRTACITDPERKTDLAFRLNLLTMILNNLRMYKDAETSSLESVQILKAITASGQSEYLSEYAFALNVLGSVYQTLANKIKAEEYTGQAVAIFADLAKDNPSKYNIIYSMSLRTLATLQKENQKFVVAEQNFNDVLTNLIKQETENKKLILPIIADVRVQLGFLYQSYYQQYSESEAQFMEGLELYTQLDKEEPGIYLEKIASVQESIALNFQLRNQYDKARGFYLKALDIYRSLAENNTELYSPGLASCLEKYAGFLQMNQEFLSSELYFKESLHIYSALVRTNNPLYLANQASVYNGLAFVQQAYGNLKNSIENYRHALEIYRGLAKDQPNIFLSKVAYTLNYYAYLLLYSHQPDSAYKSYEESLQIYTKLALENKQEYLPWVAFTNNYFGYAYQVNNEFISAKGRYSEALRIYEELATGDSLLYKPQLGFTLNNLAYVYQNLGYPEAAEKYYLRALNIYTGLISLNRSLYLPNVAYTRKSLALLLQSNERINGAKVLFEEALMNFQELFVYDPGLYQSYLGEVNLYIGDIERILNHPEKAEKYFSVSANHYKELSSINPQMYDPYYAWVLLKNGTNQNELKHYSEGIQNFRTAIQKYNTLMKSDPKQFLPLLSISYGNLAYSYLFTNQFKVAETASRQALDGDSNQTWINTNLAHALLFQGKFEEAKAIYLQYKDQPYPQKPEKTFREIFLKDLEELEEAGVTHPDIVKIGELLKK